MPAEDIFSYLNNTLEKMIQEDYKKYNIFTNFKFDERNSRTDRILTSVILKKIVEEITQLYESIKDDEEKNIKIAIGYEEILNNYLQENPNTGYGELCTPKEIATLLSNLIINKYSEKIYDPACGTGSFLVEATKKVQKTDVMVEGIEKANWMYNVAIVNLILHEVKSFNIVRENQDITTRSGI